MTDTAPGEVPEAEPETDDTRSARERVIDHLADPEGPQSVEQILAGTGLNRNACEQAVFRAKKAEQIIWVEPAVYALRRRSLCLHLAMATATKYGWRE